MVAGQTEWGSERGEGNMIGENNGTKVEAGGEDYNEFERNYQEFFDFEGVFFFLLGILGGVLVVVLGLILVQQGKVNKSETMTITEQARAEL